MTRDQQKHGKRYDTGPSLGVVVGDHRGGWNNGVFAGDPVLVQWAEEAAACSATVKAFGLDLTADSTTPMGALAAFASYEPGRCVVHEAPEEVLEALPRETKMAEDETAWANRDDRPRRYDNPADVAEMTA